MGDDSLDLLRGTLDVLILRALAGGPVHGYGIVQWIRRRTDDVLQVKDGALYQAMRRLEENGCVEAEWGISDTNRRARFYSLTAAGRARLHTGSAQWHRYAGAIAKVLDPAPGDAR